MTNLTVHKTPPASIIVPYYVFAALSFLLLSFLIFISGDLFDGHYFQPKLLAITHITTLGWVTMIIFGALYQMIPVILQVNIFSNLIARINFFLLAGGVVLLAYSFWYFRVGWPMQIASLILVASFALFLFNLVKTANQSKHWQIETDFIITSAFWLLFTDVIGAIIAFNFRYAFLSEDHLHYLKFHVHIGFIGWFFLLIVGVASKLFPMFLLTKDVSKKGLSLTYYSINLGLILNVSGWFVSFYPIIFLGYLCLLIGVAAFLNFIRQVYKNRVRKSLDLGMKHSFLAVILVSLPVFTGLFLAFHNASLHSFSIKITMLYGMSVLLGAITGLILGQTFKTLPFIVWIYKYKSKVGKELTPLPRELFSEFLIHLQMYSFVGSLFFILVGIALPNTILIKTGTLLLFTTAVIYNINVFKILLHKYSKK